MALFITILQFFAGLSILIVLHELGHFLAAKYFGVRVEKFYLFFDFLFPFPEVAKFSLFKKKVGDTEYGIGWFPFGGYVQMSGIMDENMDKEALKEPVKDYEFRAKPAWQRLIILLGGIIVNVLVAFVLYSFNSFVYGDEYLTVENQTYGIYADSTGRAIGLQTGDIITYVEDKKIEKAGEAKMEMLLSMAENITYERNGVEGKITGLDKMFYKEVLDNQRVIFGTASMSVIGKINDEELKASGAQVGDKIIEFEGQGIEYHQELSILKKDFKGEKVDFKVLRGDEILSLSTTLDEEGFMGFENSMADFSFTHRDYNFFQALVAGPVKSWRVLKSYIRQMKLVFDPVVKGFRHIGGFGTIGKLYSGGFSLQSFFAKTAFISIMLAFMNLLPIPALDGGHAMFTVYEMIVGKPAPEKFMYYAQLVGMMILFGLLIYANGMDIIRAFF